jgi:hypothetical protein
MIAVTHKAFRSETATHRQFSNIRAGKAIGVGVRGDVAGKPAPGAADRTQGVVREKIGTYNILRRPLELHVRNKTAGGRRRHRANRSRGSETTLKSLRSANKKTAAQRRDWLRPQQTCGLHAHPSHSATGNPDTFVGISLKS